MIIFYLVCLPYWIFVDYIFVRLNNTWPSDRTEILLKVAWTPSNKHIQSVSGPLTHHMSLHSVRGSIVIHIHKEGVIRSQRVCKPLSYGSMTIVCVYKVFVKPLSYGHMTRVCVQKVFVNPLSYGSMTIVCVYKVFVKPLSYGPTTTVSSKKCL